MIAKKRKKKGVVCEWSRVEGWERRAGLALGIGEGVDGRSEGNVGILDILCPYYLFCMLLWVLGFIVIF